MSVDKAMHPERIVPQGNIGNATHTPAYSGPVGSRRCRSPWLSRSLFLGACFGIAYMVHTSEPAQAQGTDSMTISPQGNVGIGTVEPKQKLDVVGNVNISGSLSAGMGAIPLGMIAMWSGEVGKLPKGWVLCNGQAIKRGILPGDKAPDLRGRFVVGYDPGNSDYDEMGKLGGEAKHELSSAEMGHSHTLKPGEKVTGGHKHGGLTTTVGGFITMYGPTTEGTPASNATPHENRPPFMALAYIVYIGAEE